MEKKQNFFAKFNMKDYTNQLEKILEKKNFSLDTKNLLLSMFYKIENAYQDYEKVKVVVPSKSGFLTSLLFAIEHYCNNIVVAKFDSEASKLLEKEGKKYVINYEERTIIAYGNEFLVLSCIFKLAQSNIVFPEEQKVIEYAFNQLLKSGSVMNKAEVIRDFSGWSWDVIVKEIEDIPRNLVYQTLLYLLGEEFLAEWQENKSELADYITLMQSKIQEEYGEKRAKKIVELVARIAINMVISVEKEQKEIFQQLKQERNKEYELLSNKQEYLEKITKNKKDYTKQIEEIDKIINDKNLLKEEYEKRNKKLPNKLKIFSISHLTDRLEKERQQLLEKIKECNQCIDPMGFVRHKEEVKNKFEFLNELDLEKTKKQDNNLLDLCELFLECFQIKVTKEQNKKEFMNCIYELRYYQNLTFDKEGMMLKDIPKLKPIFEKIIQLLIQKGRELTILDFITEDEKANEQIISRIFYSKMIDLDHLVIITKVEKGKLWIEYYDTNVLENTIELQSKRTLKLKKKTKLFI